MKIRVTDIFKKNYKSKATVVLNEGGARSSKSYSICQLFILKFLNEKNKNFLITRKTLPSLRITAYKLFIDLLKEYKYYNKVDHNKTFREFRYKNNYLLATSIDEASKIQSTDFNYIWMEEAEEFTYEDYVTLKTRLSGIKNENERNQIFLTYNPKKEFSYINKKVKCESDIEIINSTYKDNPTLNPEYVSLLEGLKEQSTDFHKIFTLGQYANADELIYGHIKNIASYPEEFDNTVYGLDFGYNVPTALVRVDSFDKKFYLTELLYQTKLTNADLIERLKDLIPDKNHRIYCDSAEPGRIQELDHAGFYVKDSKKNVKEGIDYVKRQEIYTKDENVNLNKELEEYVWKKGPGGELTDEPVRYNSHLMDALRYAIYSSRESGVPNIRWIYW